MPHFLIKKEQINSDTITLFKNDEDFFHLTKALRIKIGEKVKFIDQNGIVYLTNVILSNKSELKAKIVNRYKTKRILNNNICLIQSILANDAQNLLIANATQTGIKEIYPVISDNTSLSFADCKNKTEKWKKISYENFKQCERGDLVRINPIMTLKEALNEFKKENIIVFAEKNHNIILKDCIKNIDKSQKIAAVTGPEGGFSGGEFDFFEKENFNLAALGSMIYKAPNAVVAGIYGIVSLLE